jgi:hypothetical protein
MKAKIINELGIYNPELADLKADRIIDIVIAWLTERDVEHKSANRNHISDVLPELHKMKTKPAPEPETFKPDTEQPKMIFKNPFNDVIY